MTAQQYERTRVVVKQLAICCSNPKQVKVTNVITFSISEVGLDIISKVHSLILQLSQVEVDNDIPPTISGTKSKWYHPRSRSKKKDGV